jgi:hypothetical protein
MAPVKDFNDFILGVEMFVHSPVQCGHLTWYRFKHEYAFRDLILN